MTARPNLVIRSSIGPAEYPALVEIWRSAVRATHDFLEDVDFARIESLLASAYFPAVTLRVLDLEGGPLGFAGFVNEASKCCSSRMPCEAPV